MKTCLILHGTPDKDEYYSADYPSPSNSHWLPWLQKEFLKAGTLAQTPEMPHAYQPDYEAWRAVFEQFPIDEDTVLVGHSCGGGFLVRWLSENRQSVTRVVLVAPWLDPTGRKCPDFFRFTIDPGLTDRTELHIIESDNDMEDIPVSIATIRAALPAARHHLFPGYGHFCQEDMQTGEFPGLRDIAMGLSPT